METARILICEDEAIVARDISVRLETYGYRIAGVAADSESALRIAKEMRPDLALMDIRLKGSTPGTEIAATLSNEFNIPSIFLTAYGDVETLQRARRADPLAYLQKPVRDQELRMAIEIGLKSRRRQRRLREELKEYRATLERIAKTSESPIALEQRLADALANELTANVVGGIAHHVNNILCALMGNLEWLKQCPTIKPFEHRFVVEAYELASRLGSLVQKLMWSSREGLFEHAFMRLSELVKEAVAEFNKEHANGIEAVETGELGHISGVAFVSPPALKQSLHELFENAAEAQGGHGEILVSLSEEFVELPELWNAAAKPGWYFVITVSDRGPGIEVEPLSDVFQPFQTTREHRNALGLGLAVVRGVAMGHGGWVALATEKGAGTTVRVFIPRVRSEHDGEKAS